MVHAVNGFDVSLASIAGSGIAMTAVEKGGSSQGNFSVMGKSLIIRVLSC